MSAGGACNWGLVRASHPFKKGFWPKIQQPTDDTDDTDDLLLLLLLIFIIHPPNWGSTILDP